MYLEVSVVGQIFLMAEGEPMLGEIQSKFIVNICLFIESPQITFINLQSIVFAPNCYSFHLNPLF